MQNSLCSNNTVSRTESITQGNIVVRVWYFVYVNWIAFIRWAEILYYKSWEDKYAGACGSKLISMDLLALPMRLERF